MSFSDLPTFDELENKRRFWPAKPGSYDEGLGMLRYLTPEHVAEVVKAEVKSGDRVCLNWDMSKLETPGTSSSSLIVFILSNGETKDLAETHASTR